MSFPPQGGTPQQPYPPGAWGQPPQYQQPPQHQQTRPGMLHGYAGDPRYPSPRKLRRVFGFTVDWVIHVGCAVATEIGAQHVPSLAKLPVVWAILVWLIVSFLHRVPIQAACGTTLGKALFGLRMIRPVDGGKPGFGQLAGAWVRGIWVSIIVVAGVLGASTTGDDLDEDKTFLPVVRRRDVRALLGA
ncbi:MAG TPA: RDD family protein [Pseudonocardiaceae bacterium]